MRKRPSHLTLQRFERALRSAPPPVLDGEDGTADDSPDRAAPEGAPPPRDTARSASQPARRAGRLPASHTTSNGITTNGT